MSNTERQVETEKRCVYSALRADDGKIIESRHQHDYQHYTDKKGKQYMLDGGIDYVRWNGNGELITVCLEDGHERVREVLSWGTFGKNGDEKYHLVKLMDMDTAHIKACVATQPLMHPHIAQAFKDELVYRGEQ